jgi:hypothetical protein
LALRHPARFAQLTDTLPDILHRLAVRPFLEELAVVTRQFLLLRRRNKIFQPRRQQAQATTAVAHASAVLHKPADFAADDFSIHFGF